MGKFIGTVGSFFRRVGYLARACAWAVALGLIETLRSERGRRLLALGAVAALGVGVAYTHPVRTIAPGEVGVRTNRITGGMTDVGDGWAIVIPGLHELRRYSTRDQVYRPVASAHAGGDAPYQSVEGLSIGVDVAVRYAIDPKNVKWVASRLPEDLGAQLVEPTVDGILHRTFASHTVREIFSSQRAAIQTQVERDLRDALAGDGVRVEAVFLGNVDLPEQYKSGLESLLGEELAGEKMRYTLELKTQQVKQSELEAEADKVRRQKSAEALGLEEIIAAQSKAEAMKHVLPFKEKEIEQRRLEAEANKVSRIKQAEGEADARRLEAGAEADARRKLADSDAYRMEVTGKASSAQLARESELIRANPLLIQKTMADKLSDKIQVIIASPSSSGFVAGNLIGGLPSRAGSPGKSADRDHAAEGREAAASPEYGDGE